MRFDDIDIAAILDRLDEIVLYVTLDGRVLGGNAAAVAAYGYSAEELAALDIRDIRVPEEVPAVDGQLQAASAGGTRFRTAHRRRDGSTIQVEVRSAPLTIDGHPALLSIVDDLSEPLAAAARLEESRGRLADFIAGTNIGTWEWHVPSGATVFNERWAEIVGYTLAELEPVSIQTWVGLCHPDDLDASNAQLEEVFARRRVFYDIECRMRHRQGHWVWVHDRGKVVSWTEDGAPELLRGTHADVTAAHEAAAALAESEKRYRLLFAQSPTAIELYGGDGRLLGVNPACLELFGVEDERELTGFDLFADPSISDEQKERLRRGETVRYQSVFDFDLVRRLQLYRTSRRGEAWLDVLIVPLGAPGVDYLVEVQEITGLKHREAALRAERDLAVALAVATDLPPVLDLAMQAALAIDGVDAGGVYLVDPVTGDLDLAVRSYTGLPQAFARSGAHYPADSAEAQVVLAGSPIYGRYRDVMPAGSAVVEGRHTLRAVATVPIRFDGRVVAALTVSSLSRDDFTAEARVELETLAAQFGATLARLRAQHALRESEERYRLIAENASSVVVQGDNEGLLQWVSPSVASLMGWTPEELTGRPFAELIHPDDVSIVRAAQRGLLAGDATDFEARIRSRSGDYRWFSTTVRPVFDDAGVVVGRVGSWRDIEDEVRAREALAASEERFRTLFEAMTQGVVFLAADGRITAANPAAERILGLSLDQLQGRTPSDPRWRAVRADGSDFPGEDHPAMVALRTGRLVSGVQMGVHDPATGSTRWILIDAVPQTRPGDETPFQVFTVFTDVTDQLSAAAQIARLSAMRDIAEQVALVGSVRTELTTGTSLWSPETYRLLDIPADTEPSHLVAALRERLHPDDLDLLSDPLDEVLATGRARTVDMRLRWRDGSEHVVSRGGEVEHDAAGTPVAIVGYLQDVTGQRRVEAEIRGLNAELERRVDERTSQLEATNRELEQFVYSAAHDLRAPLRAIDGFSETVAYQAAERLTEDERADLQRVRRAAQRMALLIDHLMALSRLARQDLLVEPVDVSAVAQEVCDEVLRGYPDRDLDIAVGPGLTAAADAAVLRVVLANLVDNACKYTSKRDAAHIEIGVREAEGERAFFVRDDGAGLDLDKAPQLFGAFQRFHHPADYPGDGIGLATVRRLLARHGGRVWAESAVDRGATFYFTLGTPSTGA